MKISFLAGLGGLVLSHGLAHGQLRIVQYNSGDVKAGVSTVLEQIGHETTNGIARPVDVLIVEEQDNAASVANLASTLNGIYGAGAYAAAPYVGTTSGGGLPGMVYRTSSLSLVGSPVGIGTVNTSSNARQTIKYTLRPSGYDSAADFYVYASHLKASNTSSDATRRNVEVTTNRAEADLMGPGTSIIYAGDFNLYSGNEAAFQTLLAPGNAQAIDPVSAPLSWGGSSNRVYFTQSPATSAAYGGQVTGGMNDRFDFQLVTAALHDGEGMSYIPGSYRAFGNNGTQPLSGAVNSGSNTWNNAGLTQPRESVLNALAQASDHIPVVADYQLPAKMSVSVGSIPSTVIVGAAVPVSVTVSNSAPVTVANGADELDYTISGGGAIGGNAAGTVTATFAGNVHALALNTATPGVKCGTVNVSGSSQSVANGSFSQARSTTVLAHAKPSFVPDAQATSVAIDFGVRALGTTVAQTALSIHNLADPSGFTAGLDVDSIVGSGDTSKLASTLTAFANQPAGGAHPFAASIDTSQLGSLQASYTIITSDQDLPGAASGATLSVQLSGIIALGGDSNLDGAVDVNDLGALASNWNAPGDWSGGDFDRNGLININDLGMLASNWQAGTGLAPSLAAFGLPAVSVPEPTLLTLVPIALMLTRRRR